jgi:hypothetical protein
MQLGNVINGPGPIVSDDEDEEDLPINQTMNGRVSMMNPMMSLPMPMGYGGPPVGSPGWNNMSGWPQQQPNSPTMLNPSQFMVPAPSDPNLFMAHQQAMMMAKQAYQLAVAQQAMAAAAEEWERGSTVGSYGGGSMYGGGTSPTGFGQPYGMQMGMGMGMGMQNTGGGWSTGSMLFPPGPRSMYGGGSVQSEYGGGGGGGGKGGWGSSRSVYGEAFGPSGDRNSGRTSRYGQRESGYLAGPVQPAAQRGNGPGVRGTARSRTSSQPVGPARVSGAHKDAPPSSWKAGV